MFLYPPRPENRILPGLIPSFERRGWVCQLKKNGTCSLAFVDATGTVIFKTRHNEDHKAWTPTPDIILFFSQFRNSIFVFELLHSKGGGVKNTVYIFDLLMYDGKYLVGMSLRERLDILEKLKIDVPNISVAETYTTGFLSIFQNLTNPLDEGIVLKRPDAPLEMCFRDGTNTSWQVKCRKATKNYES
jgi:hypothetical protein